MKQIERWSSWICSASAASSEQSTSSSDGNVLARSRKKRAR
jgi:hypothetical protein